MLKINNEMDIEKIRKHKLKLEKEIGDAIVKFRNKTGIEEIEIEIRVDYLTRNRWKKELVGIDVNIDVII